jgi:hypothetical protein
MRPILLSLAAARSAPRALTAMSPMFTLCHAERTSTRGGRAAAAEGGRAASAPVEAAAQWRK